MTNEYVDAAVQRVLAEDEIAQLGIEVTSRGDRMVLQGTVGSEQRREEIARRVAQLVPDRIVQNEITVVRAHAPEAAEELS